MYPQQGQSIAENYRAYTGSDTAAKIANIEKPRLSQQLDQLEKVLAECHQLTGSVESAASRILGPVPEEGAKPAGRPPVDSIDQRFAELIGVAEALVHRLGGASKRLNSAV